LPDGRVPLDTAYSRFHDGKSGEMRDPADWSEGFKLNGPMANTTTYDVQL
jgi:hypothetical protein